MDKKKKLATLGFVLLALVYFLPKGLLTPVNPDEASFDGLNVSAKCGSLNIQTASILENFSCVFTVSSANGTQTVNYTLQGISSGYLCAREGLLLYAYFTSDSQSSMIFLDYNLSEKWRRELPAYPLNYTGEGLILVSNPTFGSSGSSCVYVLNISTGRLSGWFCPDVLGGHVSDVKITGGRIYVTIGEPRRPPLETHALIYMKDGEKVKKAEITSISGEGVGIRLLIDANEKYAVVSYFLANERGDEKNGICVFTAGSLRKIACKEFKEGERPTKVKLTGNIVYVQTTNGVKAYKIFSLW
ncbi:hypothetical protein [Thermococcus barossii]|uniref:Uncharacterized protein n=1 Tax=Thermococcus barossii TaxID=54077 RepID=A0A2Z2MEE4_9EURY|nr:hypothetical protein [Thermococcus barossii]ASJ04907.1 hypothetical protein A3L01_05830 [Thermococcus barossii]